MARRYYDEEPGRDERDWDPREAWRSGGRPSDYDRFSQGGEGRQYGQLAQGYGPRDPDRNEQRHAPRPELDTLRGIGAPNDERRRERAAFEGWGRHHEGSRRRGFAGKGPRGG
jgi:hypothetical protein